MASNLCVPVANFPSPVSHLPPELLIRIFEYLVNPSNPTILLQICRRWADIASSTSSFWSRIDFSTPPAPLLKRCVSRPIEVILSDPRSHIISTSNWLKAAKELLLLYNDRIRKLDLDLPASYLRELGPELSGVFPILVDVSISARCNHCVGVRPEDFPEWRPVAIPLSPIRCLRLLLVKTPWVPGCFQNLVEFFLHEQWHTDFDPPMETFLGILESSPQLAVLSVANAGPRLPVDTITLPPATRTAHLRNLRRLYLEQQDACNVGWMLIHLKIPISADVRIFVDLESGGRPVVSLELAFNLALPNHPGFPHFTNLRSCSYGVYNNLRNCSYALHFEPSCIISTPNLFFHITWNGTVRRHFGGLMMPFLCRAMAVGVIEDLTIVHDHPTGDSTSTLQWDLIFDTLHSLRKLRVKQSPGQLDLSVRAMFQSFSSPALQDLRLSFLVFDEKSQEKEKSGDRNELAESLVNWCAERDRRGCRLNRLVIEAPLNPPPGLGSLLTPHVDHIEISGKRLDNDNLWDVEFGSRQIFHYLRACR